MLDARPDYPIIDFIITNSRFIGFRYEQHLQGILIGDIIILVFSVTMRSIFKTHKLYSGVQGSVLSPHVVVNDLNPPSTPLLQQDRRGGGNGIQKSDYEKYIAVSLLKEW